jgi:hypothetical protein
MIAALASMHGAEGHERRVATSAVVDRIFAAAAEQLRSMVRDLYVHAATERDRVSGLHAAGDALIAASWLGKLAADLDKLRGHLRGEAQPWGEA